MSDGSPAREAAARPEPLASPHGTTGALVPRHHPRGARRPRNGNRRQVWNYASEHGYAIASKDSDFRQLAFLYGPPPKVIWLRVDNVNTAAVLQVILDHRAAIEAFENDADNALLVIPGLPER